MCEESIENAGFLWWCWDVWSTKSRWNGVIVVMCWWLFLTIAATPFTNRCIKPSMQPCSLLRQTFTVEWSPFCSSVTLPHAQSPERNGLPSVEWKNLTALLSLFWKLLIKLLLLLRRRVIIIIIKTIILCCNNNNNCCCCCCYWCFLTMIVFLRNTF